MVGGWVGIPEIFLHGGHKLEAFLEPVFAQSNAIAVKHEMSHTTEFLIMGISVTLALASLLFGLKKFSNYKAEGELPATGIAKLLENKWYVDEMYDKVVSQPLKSLSAFFNNVVEKKGIDGFVNGTGKFVNYGSRQLRWLQSGQVGAYILLMVIGMLLLFITQLFIKN